MRENGAFASSHRHLHKGLCWCSDMEKESELQLNPYTIIRLKHPLLKDKVEQMRKQLQTIIHVEQQQPGYNYYENGLIATQKSVALFDQFKNKPEFNGQLKHYRLQEEMDDAWFMIRKVEHEQRGKKVMGQLKEIVSHLANRYVLATTRIAEIPCTCKGEDELSLAQILPVGANTPEIICYNSCQRTLFAAYKRQMMRVFKPDHNIVEEFKIFTKKYFDTYVEPVLREFDYSYSQWFNKMPRNKQVAMLEVQKMLQENKLPEEVNYGLFCKREKQEAGGKNRAIANIDPVIKYVMGPVCWALEDLADKYFPGYCGKKNWDNLEDLFQHRSDEGFTTVLQGDGSAFDTCQHFELKYIDRLIYEYLADHRLIHHVDPVDFKRLATAEFRNLNAKMVISKRFTTLAEATIRGTVFSGASDTTLMNTLRMALYNQFTLEREGLVYGKDFYHYAKGDDFMVFVKQPTWKQQSFESLYYKTWKPKPKHSSTDFYDNQGCLGMILKFMNVGGLDTIDFCSTTCIPYCGGTRFKLARKPNRMDPLGHYSMKAKRMTNAQYKQYLVDQGYAIYASVGNMPFYDAYAQAYYRQARRIKQKGLRLATGRAKYQIPDDGHRKVILSHSEIAAQEFIDYGHDYVYGLINRESTHREVPESDVLFHLLKHFDISPIDIAYHTEFLKDGGIYDAISK